MTDTAKAALSETRTIMRRDLMKGIVSPGEVDDLIRKCVAVVRARAAKEGKVGIELSNTWYEHQCAKAALSAVADELESVLRDGENNERG